MRSGGRDWTPNTVAEYLDNMLPDDRVPDFEKVCLESDMHLAEVASCHQILALVLGEPAEVDPTSREHMYQLPQVLAELEAMEAREADVAEAADGDAVVPPPPIPRRPKPIVPDYLREQRKRRRSLLPVAVVLLLLVGGVVALGLAGQLQFLGIPRGESRLAMDPFGVGDDAVSEDGEADAISEGEVADELGGEAGGTTPSTEGESGVAPPPPATLEEGTAGVKPLIAPPAASHRRRRPFRPSRRRRFHRYRQCLRPNRCPPWQRRVLRRHPRRAAIPAASATPAATDEPSVELPGDPGQPAGIGVPSPPAAVPAAQGRSGGADRSNGAGSGGRGGRRRERWPVHLR